MQRGSLIAATAVALLLAATAPAAAAPTSVADALATTKGLSALSDILSKFPDVEAKLGDGFTGTVLAPNNKAIAALKSAAAKAGLKLTNKVLKEILLYAIVPTVYELRDLQDGWELPTLQGQPVTIKYGPSGATFLGAGSSAAIADGAQQIDVRTGNGNAVIHTLDTVLLPFALPGGATLGGGTPSDTVAAASLTDGALTNVVGNAEGAEQGVAGAVGAAQQAGEAAAGAAGAAAGAAEGAAEGAAGAAADAAQGAADAVEGAAGAVSVAVDDAFNAVAGLGAPELVDGAPAAGPRAAPASAPLPSEAGAPAAAPAALLAPPSGAAAASLQAAVLAALVMVLVLL